MSPEELIVHTRDGEAVDELESALARVRGMPQRTVGDRAGRWMQQGALLHALGRFEASVAALTEVLDLDALGWHNRNGNAATFLWRACGRLCLGELPGAERDFRWGMRGRRVEPVDLLYRGTLRWLTGDDESAVEDWRTARELDGSMTLVDVLLALVSATTSIESLRSPGVAITEVPLLPGPTTWKRETVRATTLAAAGRADAANEHARNAGLIAPTECVAWCERHADEIGRGDDSRWRNPARRLEFFLMPT